MFRAGYDDIVILQGGYHTQLQEKTNLTLDVANNAFHLKLSSDVFQVKPGTF